ncbi:uncharacterized protein LOC133260140 isoform X3 [Bos javanicus]|uniref:uncharacterized protein LOC133260140 isoform X3 n=1 Tax=Bos javanicus TaxID=9906 RepID=UPI002AA830D6|nr:uncharacterized protein LOC133260140 isoform X3 [Bos javanicus]
MLRMHMCAARAPAGSRPCGSWELGDVQRCPSQLCVPHGLYVWGGHFLHGRPRLWELTHIVAWILSFQLRLTMSLVWVWHRFQVSFQLRVPVKSAWEKKSPGTQRTSKRKRSPPLFGKEAFMSCNARTNRRETCEARTTLKTSAHRVPHFETEIKRPRSF